MSRLIDIARVAGVSVASVSHALRGTGRVSPQRREQIVRIAADLGYRENVHAVSLSRGRVTHVAVLINSDYEKAFEWYFTRRILIGLEARLSERGVYSIIVPVSFSDRPDAVVEKVAASGAGAVVAIHYAVDPVVSALQGHGVPLVLVNNERFRGTVATVSSDDVGGAYVGTNHLFQRGCGHVAFVDYPKEDIPTVLNDRFVGYRRAIEERGGELERGDVIRVPLDDYCALRRAVENLFTRSPDIDGIFAHDDHVGAMLYSACAEIGRPVPRDVSLIACVMTP